MTTLSAVSVNLSFQNRDWTLRLNQSRDFNTCWSRGQYMEQQEELHLLRGDDDRARIAAAKVVHIAWRVPKKRSEEKREIEKGSVRRWRVNAREEIDGRKEGRKEYCEAETEALRMQSTYRLLSNINVTWLIISEACAVEWVALRYATLPSLPQPRHLGPMRSNGADYAPLRQD